MQKTNNIQHLQTKHIHTKYELCNLYIYYKIKVYFIFEVFPKRRKYFGKVGGFCIINGYFKYRIRIRYI